MFMGGVGVFTAASAACGLAPSPGWLIGFSRGAGAGRGDAHAADADDHHEIRFRLNARGGFRGVGGGGRVATVAALPRAGCW